MLRRYAPIKPSAGTTIPADVRAFVNKRDIVCVGAVVGFPGECGGSYELDHVRASGGLGLKSRSTSDNLVRLCAQHHRYKTDHGREARPLLLEYLGVAS